jgi:hypothetical protein
VSLTVIFCSLPSHATHSVCDPYPIQEKCFCFQGGRRRKHARHLGRKGQGREEEALGDGAGRERDGAEERALERVRAAEGKLKEEDLREDRSDGRNEDDKGIEKLKEPQEERYEQMEREEQAEKLAIERNSRGRGFER